MRAVDRLVGGLNDIRSQARPDEWTALVPRIQQHPLREALLEDPFTRRSFEKPRGYAGDASLLDLIYGHPSQVSVLAAASARGRAINRRTTDAPAADAVRQRRRILAREVDRIAAAAAGAAEVFAIAAGHLREAALSGALSAGALARWVALDQDPLSVATMREDLAGTCVEPFEGSVRGLLTRRYHLGQFDLVYAAGLYDYLAEPVAVQLTQRCLEMLRPGGVFLFANFAASIRDAGYMESFMDWWLLLRSEVDVRRIADAAVDGRSFEVRVEREGNGDVIYAWIQRRE